jgi:hypothetical protein
MPPLRAVLRRPAGQSRLTQAAHAAQRGAQHRRDLLLINYVYTAQEYRVAVLNVHKPRGLTPYGRHKQAKEAKGSNKRRTAATR